MLVDTLEVNSMDSEADDVDTLAGIAVVSDTPVANEELGRIVIVSLVPMVDVICRVRVEVPEA